MFFISRYFKGRCKEHKLNGIEVERTWSFDVIDNTKNNNTKTTETRTQQPHEDKNNTNRQDHDVDQEGLKSNNRC